MNTKALISGVIILLTVHSLAAQDRGFQTGVEINVGKGVDSKITNIHGGISAIEGFNFNKTLYIGAGLGIGYADGLGTEIHQYTADGKEVELRDNKITDISWSAKAFARAKVYVSRSNVSPFVMCDCGYSHRIGDKGSARMNTGLYFSPGIGCDFSLFGKTL